MWWLFPVAMACEDVDAAALRAAALRCPSCMTASLEQRVAEQPDCEELSLLLAGTYSRLGRYFEAEALLEGAADPRLKVAWAEALFRLGEEAGEPLAEAVRLRPDDPTLPILWSEHLPPSERAFVLLSNHRKHPDDEQAAQAAAHALVAAGRPAQALEVAKDYLQVRPSMGLSALVGELGDEPESGLDSWGEVGLVGDDGHELVIVYSAKAARDALDRKFGELGYTEGRRSNGKVRMFSDKPVTPWVDVYDDGRVEIQRSGAVEVPPTGDSIALRPGGRRTGMRLGQMTQAQAPIDYTRPKPQEPMVALQISDLISARKLSNRRDALYRSVQSEVITWRSALTAETWNEHVDRWLPGALDQLWLEGKGLYGAQAFESAGQRRTALLDLWTTRSCTVEGMQVRRMIGAYIRNVVEASDTPFPPGALAEVPEICGMSLTR